MVSGSFDDIRGSPEAGAGTGSARTAPVVARSCLPDAAPVPKALPIPKPDFPTTSCSPSSGVEKVSTDPRADGTAGLAFTTTTAATATAVIGWLIVEDLAMVLALVMIPVNFDYWLFALLVFLNGLGGGIFTAPNTAAIMSASAGSTSRALIAAPIRARSHRAAPRSYRRGW